MFNHFRPPQLPQYPVGGWFFREFNIPISPTVPSQVYPKKFPKKLAANEKGLWKLGNLKTFCPNVRRYKLLMLSYLQMFGSFRQTEQKYKIITNVQLLPSAQLPQTPVGRSFYSLSIVFK
jgi:hypothetical protein